MTTSDRISRIDESLSRDTGVSVPALRAIRQVESGGNARAVRFETRVFHNRTGQTVEGHTREAFQRAYAINPTEAVNSTSWGWYQVMGFHGFPAMYGGAAQAVRAFDADPEAVSLALFKRWMSKSAARTAKAAAARLDFATFASVYNGCAMPCERYATRMQAAYDRALPEWEQYLRTRPAGGVALFAVLAGVAGGVGWYFYRRKRKTGAFFGVREQEALDRAADAWNEQANRYDWWKRGHRLPDPHGDGDPGERRKGRASSSKDSKGIRTTVIHDEFDCNDLNHTIKWLLEGKKDIEAVWSLNPDDFEDVLIEVDDDAGMPKRVPFDVEVLEGWEYDVDEWIDEVRAVARANGCQQIAGLRSPLHRRMP